ncbi:hypothetical protein ACLOJK_032665 [Asimina triloba]
MSAAAVAAAISYNPTTSFSPPTVFRLQSPISISSLHEFPASKPGFGGRSRLSGFYSGKVGRLGQKQMIEMSTNSSFGSDGDTENGRYMETEAILSDGSSEVQRDFWCGGLESTLNKSSKWLVAAMFGSLILLKHDAEALWAAGGAVLNSSLSISLKKILNQQRPVSALRSDPGMPSSHAQSIFYAAIFAIVSCKPICFKFITALQFNLEKRAALIEWQGTNALSLTIGAVIFLCGSYLGYVVMVTSLAATSHRKPSRRGGCVRIHLLNPVVLVMARIHLGSI